MTEKEYFNKEAEAGSMLTVLHRFKNGYGEEFAIYKMKRDPSVFYVTGDELDWELGYFLMPGSYNAVYKGFKLSESETDSIKAFMEGQV